MSISWPSVRAGRSTGRQPRSRCPGGYGLWPRRLRLRPTSMRPTSISIPSRSCRSPRSLRPASGIADRLPLPVRGRVRGHGGGLAGLESVLLRAATVEEYRAAIETLIADPARRTALGAATRERIEQSCMGDGWRAGLGEVYRSAAAAHLRRQPHVWEEPGPGDLDWFIPFAYGNEAMGASRAGRLAGAMEFVLKAGPFWWRSAVLLRMAAAGDSARAAFAVALPHPRMARTAGPAAHSAPRVRVERPSRPNGREGPSACQRVGSGPNRRRRRRRCRRRVPGCRTRRRLRLRPGAPDGLPEACSSLRPGCGRR